MLPIRSSSSESLYSDADVSDSSTLSSSVTSSVTEVSASSSLSSTTNSRNKPVKVMHININGLRDKVDVLYTEAKRYDIVAVTETKLNDGVDTSDLRMSGFQDPIRKDRTEDSGGGIAVYMKEGITAARRNDLELNDLESIWLNITCYQHKFLLGTVYRPPNSLAYRWNILRSMLDEAEPNLFNKMLLVGDLNDDLLPGLPCPLLNIIESYELHQFISEPTRVTPTSATLLDPIISNCPDMIRKAGVIMPFSSDHHGTFAQLQFKVPHQKCYKKTVWKYDNVNFDGLKQDLASTDWGTLFINDDIDITTTNVTDHILKLCDKHIPHKEILVRPSDPPWLTTDVKRLIRKRNRLHKKAKEKNTENHWANFRGCRNDVIQLVRDTKKEFLKKQAQKLADRNLTTRQWWSVVKALTKAENNSYTIPALVNDEGEIVTKPEDKANVLNSFFTSQSILHDENIPSPSFDPVTNVHLDEIIITENEVKTVLSKLNPSKAMGPDKINPRVLKECAEVLCTPLCNMFNLSLQQQKVPRLWKHAFVSAIYKKVEKNQPINYRPISLLSCIAKVMEKCVFICVYSHLTRNSLITRFQSGFQPGDNTVNQLIDVYDTICQGLDEGKEVRAVFCDIQKAFDRVWHRGLIAKLKGYGIRGQLLNWFEDYLANRSQSVVLDGHKSTSMNVCAGVPQGSILGPLLFIVYINDIVRNIVSSIRLFADDTAIYLVVENPVRAAEVMNSDLQKIHSWAEKWLVNFSAPKTKSMIFTRHRNTIHHPPLSFNNVQIDEVDNHKHLGLILSKDGSWSAQVNAMYSKANRALNILRKMKRLLDRKTLYRLYCTQVCPLLEYADCVWININKEQADKLESINLEAARIITGAPRGTRHNLLYEESGLELLSERRRKHQLTLYFKIKKGLAPAYLSVRARVPPYQPHPHRLRNVDNDDIMSTNTVSYKHSFFHSSIREWNSLSPSVRDLNQSVQAFKNSLNRNRKKPPDHYLQIVVDRATQIIHANMRTQSSNLNYHLFERYLKDDSACNCGAPVEDAIHFFKQCPLYRDLRNEIFGIHVPSLNEILCGSLNDNTEKNIQLFTKVQQYIKRSERF